MGRWLDEHPLKKGQYNNGTMADQIDAAKAFINMLSSDDYGEKTGTDEVITALHDDYKATEYDDDLAVLKATLAKINGAKTKEALYEQMGQLVKDGYQMPFEYVCKPVERRVAPVLEFPGTIKELSATAEDLMELAGEGAQREEVALSGYPRPLQTGHGHRRTDEG